MKSKVAVIPCDSYDSKTVYEAVQRGIELLGGWESFIKSEEKLLLKPNLLSRFGPDRAVTTHPAVFEAVGRSLLDSGFRRVFYGDSPGMPGSAEKTAEVCGLKASADRLGIPFADFGQSKTVEYTRGMVTRKYELCKGVLDTDGIINICKMKTHQLERITGAVKNLFGCVYSVNKAAAHTKYPDAESFAQMLVDLNLLLKPRIHIMDGIVAMEGNGPASGDPVNMNVILISADPVALDATYCRLIDLDPANIPTITYGSVHGLGHWKEEEIEILGVDDLADYRNPDFNVRRDKAFGGRGIWAFANKLNVITRKPVILEERCIRCGACVAACPVEGKAVNFPEKQIRESGSATKKAAPVYNYKKCIKCYCCQEMCPEQAIVVKRML